MASSPAFSEGEGTDSEETRTVAESDLTAREDQLLQSITDMQSRLDNMSQQQDELMRLVGPALRGLQGGSASGAPNVFLVHANTSRSYNSREALGRALPTDWTRMSEQSHQVPASYRPVPGHPATQQPPPYDQVQGPGQPTYHHFNPSGRPMIHSLPPPPPYPGPPLSRPAHAFDHPDNRTGNRTVVLVRRGSLPHFEPTATVPDVRYVPPGWTQPHMCRPPAHPQTYSQACSQMPDQMVPRVPTQLHPQIQPSSMPIRTRRLHHAPDVYDPPVAGDVRTRANPSRRARPRDLSDPE